MGGEYCILLIYNEMGTLKQPCYVVDYETVHIELKTYVFQVICGVIWVKFLVTTPTATVYV